MNRLRSKRHGNIMLIRIHVIQSKCNPRISLSPLYRPLRIPSSHPHMTQGVFNRHSHTYVCIDACDTSAIYRLARPWLGDLVVRWQPPMLQTSASDLRWVIGLFPIQLFRARNTTRSHIQNVSSIHADLFICTYEIKSAHLFENDIKIQILYAYIQTDPNNLFLSWLHMGRTCSQSYTKHQHISCIYKLMNWTQNKYNSTAQVFSTKVRNTDEMHL